MKWKKREHNKEIEKSYLDNGVNRLVSRLLSQRGITIQEAKNFLKSPYENLSDPFSLPNMKEAVDIFCWAIDNKKTVAVMGDYDCDGVISSSMVYDLCRFFNLDCKVFLPHRIKHGYGFSPKTVSAFKEKMSNPPDLVMVLDCGSNNNAEVDMLKDWGVKKIMILDHHIINKEKAAFNSDALVNWHLSDCKEMCTCGEVYQFIRGINRVKPELNPIEFLTMAAIGTIADSSPIVGDNRIIVKHGLSEYAKNHVISFGFDSLMRVSNIDSNEIMQEDVAFKIAPLINASGRLSSPDIAYRLLVEKDSLTADLIAENLVELNNKRKKIQNDITHSAIEMVKENKSKYTHGMLLYNKDWHVGVVGIVASKVVEYFGKPAIILGHNGVACKGSGRTIPGVNIKAILDNIGHKVFSEYGGHENAVGVTIKPDIIEENKIDFANMVFNAECEKYFSSQGVKEQYRFYDADIKVSSVNIDTAKKIKKFIYPYSNDNPEPIFKLNSVTAFNVKVRNGKGWSLITFNVKSGSEEVPFSFNQFNSSENQDLEGHKVNVYFHFPQRLNGKYINLNVLKIEKVQC